MEKNLTKEQKKKILEEIQNPKNELVNEQVKVNRNKNRNQLFVRIPAIVRDSFGLSENTVIGFREVKGGKRPKLVIEVVDYGSW